MREMSGEERKWWKSFKRVVKNKPKTVELNARVGGEFGIAPLGARASSFNERGDADTFYEGEWDCVDCDNLDGRDSHL